MKDHSMLWRIRWWWTFKVKYRKQYRQLPKCEKNEMYVMKKWEEK